MTILKRLFEKGDIIFYYVFLWQLPFSWRFILVENRGVIKEHFNEYMDISLYLGEIFLLCALLIYIINNINIIKSILNKVSFQFIDMFHMEHILFFLTVAILITNISISIDFPLSLNYLWHILFLIIFIFLTYHLFVSRGTFFLRDILTILILSLIFQFFIASYQVITQHSFGLKMLNESHITIETINIAKFEVFNVKIIRGYGTFPHPNILAAYSLMVYLFYIRYQYLFHVKQKNNIFVILLILLLLLLSGSKTGIFLFFVLYLFSSLRNLFHVKQIVIYLILFLVLCLGIIYQSDIEKSFSTRIDQFRYQSLYQTNKILFGSGIGTYRYNYDKESIDKEWWLLEPVHNIPYIIYKELGLIGLFLLIVIIIYIYKSVPRGTKESSVPLILMLIIYMNNDHFFWDIQQGMYILVILLCLLLFDIDKYKNKLHYK